MLVLGTHGVQFVQERLIRDRAGSQALLIQHGHDAVLVLVTRGRLNRKQSIVKQ